MQTVLSVTGYVLEYGVGELRYRSKALRGTIATSQQWWWLFTRDLLNLQRMHQQCISKCPNEVSGSRLAVVTDREALDSDQM